MTFTQESWDSLQREKAIDGLTDLLAPELGAAVEEAEIAAVCGLLEEVLATPPTLPDPRKRGKVPASRGETAQEKSLRWPDRIVHDCVMGRAYYRGVEIDLAVWRQKHRLVARKRP